MARRSKARRQVDTQKSRGSSDRKTSRASGGSRGASGGSGVATGGSRGASGGSRALVLRRTGGDLFLLSAGALLFTLSFPSFLSDAGFWPLAWVSMAPAIYVVNRSSTKRSAIYGLFCGLLTYVLHNYWIGSFHVLATLLVPLIYGVYYVILFPVLSLARRTFPRMGYLVQALLWVSYEYLRTLGFLGYAYGIIGYSQYRLPALVRFSSLTGIWGVTLLVILPSMLIATIFARALSGGQGQAGSDRHEVTGTAPGDWRALGQRLFGESVRFKVDFLSYAVVLGVVVLLGGVFLRVDYSGSRNWRVALIQQDVDPHDGGLRAYEESLDRSIRQSEAALAEDSEIEAVIWSETSFVPPINYHSQFRENPDTLALVNRLQRYMARQSVPFIIGNSDARRERQPDGSVERVDYNASLLFEDGEIVETYRKIHLVPFTEHFPYTGALGWMRNILLDLDTYFWGEGSEYTVFETRDGVKFSTPICFEDTFGYLSRNFVREGADVIVNLTNDRWAESVSAAMQHLAMAVFRSGENRRTMVRGTNGGMTAVVDPNGVITAMDEPMRESFLIADAPIYSDTTTLYTRLGDWFAFLVLALAGIAIISGIYRSRGKS